MDIMEALTLRMMKATIKEDVEKTEGKLFSNNDFFMSSSNNDISSAPVKVEPSNNDETEDVIEMANAFNNLKGDNYGVTKEKVNINLDKKEVKKKAKKTKKKAASSLLI
jgi:hypothetical protein